MLQKPKIYSIQVTGIKCTNCAGKIKTSLDQHLEGEQSKVSVNILQETVSISTRSSKDIIPSIVSKLQDLGYPAIKQPLLLDGGQENQRHLTIQTILNHNTQNLEIDLKDKIMGIVSVNRTHQYEYLKFKITYDCEVIKGKEIAQFLEKYDPHYKIINHRVQSFKSAPKKQNQQMPLKITIVLCAFFLIFNMILPFTGKWYDKLITFPEQLKIFSFSVILNLILAGYVFIKYTKPVIYRAFHNFSAYRATDMQTLISLGCLSAFALCALFFIKYGLQVLQDKLKMPHMAVMDINDALTSASIIILVVNIGKFFEHKVKRKIQAMSQQIFPESTLFSNMMIQLVQLQNRKLKIKGKKNIDSTLLEKGDIVCLNSLASNNSRLLVDVIVISGKIRAMQSTTTGCDDIIQFGKGDRVQSGAIIYNFEQSNNQISQISQITQNNQCLAIVQNVFEKSMLVQIGTQIKFSQNQEDNKTDGIQAVCKSIANVFVKAVVLLSLLTILVWALLIRFKMVTLQDDMCSICWIVERGIGVLVASCPCALGLAVPSVIAIVLNLATKSGILIKNNGVFEKMKITKKISFDKTGTLFTRINKIEEYHIFSKDLEEPKIWEIIALIEKQIRHPLAQILYKQAFKRCQIQGTNYNFILVQTPKVQKQGLSAQVRNKITNQTNKVLIGNSGILMKNNLKVPTYQKNSNAGTQLFLVVGNKVQLVLLLNTHSNLRPQARQVIKKIMQEGEEVHILSGDSRQSVINIANILNIPQFALHPQHSSFMKMDWIKSVQQSGKQGVMMIGDGLNDIPCLQQSSIGVSINAKSQLNINAADVVVLEQNLYKILALIRLLKKGNLFININLFWAFSYNIIIMPIVAGVFYKWDIWVSPIWSSIAMSLSSIIVVSISHLLSFFKFDDSLEKDYKFSKIDINDTKNNSELMSIVSGNSSNIMKKQNNTGKYLELIQSN